MKIQFDGEITDIPALEGGLKVKGLKVISITASRWVGRDDQGNPIDRGGRIDIEVTDDHLLKEKEVELIDLEIAMIESDKTTVTGDINDLLNEKRKKDKTPRIVPH